MALEICIIFDTQWAYYKMPQSATYFPNNLKTPKYVFC